MKTYQFKISMENIIFPIRVKALTKKRAYEKACRIAKRLYNK